MEKRAWRDPERMTHFPGALIGGVIGAVILGLIVGIIVTRFYHVSRVKDNQMTINLIEDNNIWPKPRWNLLGTVFQPDILYEAV